MSSIILPVQSNTYHATSGSGGTGAASGSGVNNPHKRLRTTTTPGSGGSSAVTMATIELVLEQQLESLQAELDHERSLRILDQRQAQQQRERLERQVALAMEEAGSARTLLDEFREESQQITTKLRAARDAALAHVRDLELQVLQQTDRSVEGDDEGNDPSTVRYWKVECHRLQSLLESHAARATELERQKEEFRAEQSRIQAEQRNRQLAELPLATPGPPRILEEASPEVLKELQRVRIQLAESEREKRQIQRSLKTTEQRLASVVREREQAILLSERVPNLQRMVDELQHKVEADAVRNQTWDQFSQKLLSSMNKIIQLSNLERGGPPELSTVLRALDTAHRQMENAQKQANLGQQQVQKLQEALDNSAAKQREMVEAERKWHTERKDLEEQCRHWKQQCELGQAQKSILNQELESLRSLLKTFDELPIGPGKSLASSPGQDMIKVTLTATQQELDLLQKERDRLLKELERIRTTLDVQRTENDQTRAKFFKLRDALEDEKAKRENAEIRATKAEELTGKGMFNPERTRVLHMEETPLVQALKEEISVLKRQIEAYTGSISDKSFVAHDPDKLNQRLKQNFKEQIALFREGVYLMTGYKVDMLPAGPGDRPTFRVRSMFAEREEDHLMLKWPDSTKGQVTSLDILGTDLAKLLSSTPSYKYMTDFNSLPAFLASVQLSLFEQQTCM